MYQLNDILGNPVAIMVLELFLKNPSQEFYRSQVTGELSIAKASTGKWLRALEESRAIVCTEKANAKFYRLNTSNPLVKQLKVLFSLSEIIPAFNGLEDEVYVYGSVARGDDTEDSDVDVLVLSNRSKRDVVRDISRISKKLGKPISPTVFTPVEFSKLSRKDRPFYERVNKDRIRISDAK